MIVLLYQLNLKVKYVVPMGILDSFTVLKLKLSLLLMLTLALMCQLRVYLSWTV